jgi:hypothetical protein
MIRINNGFKPIKNAFAKKSNGKDTFFCLECGLDKTKSEESDYEPEVCKDCTEEDELRTSRYT